MDDDDEDEPPGGGNTRAALEALKAERESLTEQIQSLDAKRLVAQPSTDPDARVMRRGHVGYNVQTSVDGKHHLIVDVDVVQSAVDQDQLYRMARRSQRQLREKTLRVLADAGYSSGWHFKRCQAHGLTPYVPVNRSINNRGDGRLFDKSVFTYDAHGDYFKCPAGETLSKKTKSTRDRLYLYTSEACTGCRLKQQCTLGKQRWVSRHFEEDVLNEVADRMDANPLMMRRRKAMVEHPFGTLKRRMDGGRFLVRGIQKVKGGNGPCGHRLQPDPCHQRARAPGDWSRHWQPDPKQKEATSSEMASGFYTASLWALLLFPPERNSNPRNRQSGSS